ncbi:glycosyltransferase family 4 protein [Pseudomonadota bacterium]
MLAFLGATYLLIYRQQLPLEYFLALGVGGALVAIVSYLDDRSALPVRHRILVHFIAAGCALYLLGGFPPIPFGYAQLDLGWFGYAVGGLFLVWLVNLYNFMDGIDGIAGGEAMTVAASASVIAMGVVEEPTAIQTSILLLQFVLAAASLGFLLWNWPPAKIFMGDVGSCFVGFILGVLALLNSVVDLLPIWSWSILLALFLVDATVTLLRRFFRGERWYESHCCHAYQHAARRWGSHKKVTLGVILLNIFWLLPLAWMAAIFPATGFAITLLAMAPLVILAIWLGAGDQEAKK